MSDGRTQLIELLKQHANPEATDWLEEVADAIVAAGWLPPGTIKEFVSDTLFEEAYERWAKGR